NVKGVWALDGWTDKNGAVQVRPLKGLDKTARADCAAAPVTIPDTYGVVRGFEPFLRGTDGTAPVVAPGLGLELYACGEGRAGCTAPANEKSREAERIVNYSGGSALFVHLSADTVLKASKGPAWLSANPLAKHVVLIGGGFREARDQYLTPAGYMDG